MKNFFSTARFANYFINARPGVTNEEESLIYSGASLDFYFLLFWLTDWFGV